MRMRDVYLINFVLFLVLSFRIKLEFKYIKIGFFGLKDGLYWYLLELMSIIIIIGVIN